jgi:hypothetical protein
LPEIFASLPTREPHILDGMHKSKCNVQGSMGNLCGKTGQLALIAGLTGLEGNL